MNPLYYTAIMDNDLDGIRALLGSDPSSINNFNDEQKTPLLLALEKPEIEPEIIECLLDAGADVDLKDRYGRNALLMACGSGNPEIVECIFNHIDEKIILKDKTRHHRDIEGRNALDIACSLRHISLVKLLLQRGFDPFLRIQVNNRIFYSPIEAAIYSKQVVITQLLLRHDLEKTKKACSNIDMLALAVENGDEAAVHCLLEFYPSKKLHLLNRAATKGYFSITRMLLEKEYIPDHPAYESSMDRVSFPIILAAKGNHTRILTELLRHGASLLVNDGRGMTALMAAVMHSNLESVEILLNAKAEINGKCHLGKTALMYLDRIDERGKKILNLLLAFGADPKIFNMNGENVLTYFIRNSKTDEVKALLEAGINPNIKNMAGEFPLMLAIQLGKLEMVKAIIENSKIAVVNLRNNENRTALFIALKLHRLDIASYLIEKGADMHEAGDSKDNYLLHFFMQKNDILVSKFILAKLVSINKIDYKNNLPLESGNQETQKELTQYLHELEIKKFFPKKRVSKGTLRTLFSYTPISCWVLDPLSFSNNSIFKNRPTSQTTLLSLLEYFSKRCNDTDTLNEKEVCCLKVILDDYDRGMMSQDPLSNGVRNALWGQEPFCLLLANSNNEKAELAWDKHMECLQDLISQAKILPLSNDTKKSMLEIVLPGIQMLITEREHITYHMMHNFGQLYMLHPKLPLHTDHQQPSNMLEAHMFIDRILGNILGSAVICMQRGRLGEYFDRLSVGFCLEGRTREALIWVATDVLPQTKIQLKPFDDLMQQYLNQEYHPYSEIMHGMNLEQREYFAGILNFIASRHAGTRCAIHETYAPKGIVTLEGIQQYLRETMFLYQEHEGLPSGETKIVEGIERPVIKPITSLSMFSS
ncbi:MAG: ankyrin-3-like [Gammaproteobacteria bacterium]|jgi:ankyrin repeat protein|nr:ankyrin-3-like [Gammaproteobacteria bacterium]